MSLTPTDLMNSTRRELVQQIMSLIEQTVYNEAEGSEYQFACRSDCHYMGKRSRGFLLQLRASKLSPISALGALPLAEAYAALREFQYSIWEEAVDGMHSCGYRTPCYMARVFPNSITEKLDRFKAEAEKVEGVVFRVCLECVTEGCWEGQVKCEKGHKVWV